MFKKFIRACHVYHKCPEIRHLIRWAMAAKIASHLMLLLFSPFLLFALTALGAAYILNTVANWATVLPNHVVGWLHQYQQDQVTNAHEIVASVEIQKRIGTDTNEDI
jgi:autotransporter translocation and assembly factor TamB